MDHPHIGIGVFVRHNGKILLQKRIGAHGANTWSLPGGHLEMWETLEQCAVRESFEEFGIKLKNLKILGFTNDMMKDEQKHYITFFVDSELDKGTPTIKEPNKTAEFGWFDLKKLPSPLFSPLKQFLEQHIFK